MVVYHRKRRVKESVVEKLFVYVIAGVEIELVWSFASAFI
jgi:hypothetical protein